MRDRERHRLLLVVGHDHEGDAELVLDVQQLELRVLAQLLVERGERLVEQQELGALDQRARERDALALAAGELVRHALDERLHAHELQDVRHPVVDLALRDPVLPQTEGDVLLHVHVREERIGLEHHVDGPLVGRRRGDVHAVDPDAALGRALESGHHAQQRRLAGARAAEQAEDLAAVDVERDVVDGDEVAEPLGQLLEPDIGLGARVFPGLVLLVGSRAGHDSPSPSQSTGPS